MSEDLINMAVNHQTFAVISHKLTFLHRIRQKVTGQVVGSAGDL